MALSEFVQREIDRLETLMGNLAHKTMMGQNGTDEQVLIAMGRYRQLNSERQRWADKHKKREEVEESTMDEMPDEEEEEPVPVPAKRRALVSKPRPWGGT
jgi:hypothetical protein